MSNLFPTKNQWTTIAEGNYERALERDVDPHTEGENRIAMIVRQVLGLTRGHVLKSSAKDVAEGKCAQTAVFHIPDIYALATYAVKPGKSVEERIGSFKSGRTGWHGPIGQLIIPAIMQELLVIPGVTVGWNTKNGKAPGTKGADILNTHSLYRIVASGKETVGLSAFGYIPKTGPKVKAACVRVTAYVKSNNA
mgnify:CR=1 FL=1|jgi:hypothetical protein|tara:strand:+ start:14602 stop:15183 length:582 start_codon:yes stop_codon:yes gene_type:complete